MPTSAKLGEELRHHLHEASLYKFTGRKKDSVLSQVRKLLEKGADPNIQDGFERMAVIFPVVSS